MSRFNVVCIETGYGLEDRGVLVRVPDLSISSRSILESKQPPIQWIPVDFPPGLKRQRHVADHSPPTSAEVKKMWILHSLLHTSPCGGGLEYLHRSPCES
jgi:hypothetical protein